MEAQRLAGRLSIKSRHIPSGQTATHATGKCFMWNIQWSPSQCPRPRRTHKLRSASSFCSPLEKSITDDLGKHRATYIELRALNHCR
ncbi:hypothetical protein BDZ89DRAFT_398829 [Hymenopellis radicata]|nr:hypothetical protein BDZ89DRAFT_398829 [Hymenopellis radicata]